MLSAATRRKLYRLTLPFAFAIATALCAWPRPAQAATFVVTNTNNSGPGSLRQAVLDSNAMAGSDTIVFDAGIFSTPQTITLASVILINPATGDTLTITGPGQNLLTISGNNAVRIFTVESNDSATISGITFTQAVTGAIYTSGTGTLTVSNSTFTANTNGAGGALTKDFGAGFLNVSNCTFTNNTNTAPGVNGSGGGAIHNRGTATITNSTFSNNATNGGAAGGAIDNRDVMSISGSTFTGNTTTADAQNSNGGAISNQSGSQLTITNSVITGNSSVQNGGGIYYQPNQTTGPFLNITNSTISNNVANSNSNTTGDGGGLYLTGSGSVTITNSTINGNRANAGATGTAGDGGGIDVSTVLTLTNSTVSGNTVGRNGGGIYASGLPTTIVNIESSTIVNNTATVDGGGVVRAQSNPVNFRNTIVANNIDDGTAPDIFGTVNSNGYNLIENTTGATIGGDTIGNIYGVDPNLTLLQNNGGPTLTHALLPGSVAIDAANPSTFPPTDQRGVARPIDGDGLGGARADIGALERRSNVLDSVLTRNIAGDIVVTVTVVNTTASTVNNVAITLVRGSTLDETAFVDGVPVPQPFGTVGPEQSITHTVTLPGTSTVPPGFVGLLRVNVAYDGGSVSLTQQIVTP